MLQGRPAGGRLRRKNGNLVFIRGREKHVVTSLLRFLCWLPSLADFLITKLFLYALILCVCLGGSRVLQGYHSAADGSHLPRCLYRKVEPAQTHRSAHGDGCRGQAWHVSTHTHTHAWLHSHNTQTKAYTVFKVSQFNSKSLMI